MKSISIKERNRERDGREIERDRTRDRGDTENRGEERDRNRYREREGEEKGLDKSNLDEVTSKVLEAKKNNFFMDSAPPIPLPPVEVTPQYLTIIESSIVSLKFYLFN